MKDKSIFKIKDNHPIKNVIWDEIIKNWKGDDLGEIGLAVSSIENFPYGSTDLYGLQFNSNNRQVPCLNTTIFFNKKIKTTPKILSEKMEGFDYYKTAVNCSIKLKTFLEKNPQWNNINDWTIPIVEERIDCKYYGHNSNDRRVAIRRPDNKEYYVNFPDNEKDDKNLLDWVKPIEKMLTQMYYEEIDHNITNNIIREQQVYVKGLIFLYDYIDGVVEIYDIFKNRQSVYSNIIDIKLLDINIGIPNDTKEMIKNEIESGDIIVKDIKLVEYREYPKYIKIKI